MKNKSGFTLVEMLVTIVLIAVMGTTVVFSVTSLIKKTHQNRYQEQLQELFDAASTYAELSSESGGPSCATGCTFNLSNLVAKGLVDKNIYKTNNPVYKNPNTFKSNNSFRVTRTNGVKDITFSAGSCTAVKMSTLENYNWEQC